MMQIYHSSGTRGFRVIWACEELGVPYEVVPVDFSVEHRATPAWRRMNPTGKVPVMRDGDLIMYESGAMMQQVLDCYGDGRLQPAVGTPQYGLYLQWCWFAESTFSRPLGEITNHRRAFAEPIEACMEEMRDRARVCVQALEQALAGKDYLLSAMFTGADIMMGYSLRGFKRHLPDDGLPVNVGGYVDRLCARPAYQRATVADMGATGS